MCKKSLLMMLLLALFAPWAANAQETLTVCDGTDNNSYVPFYGLYADTQGAASECVIPSDLLGEMAGGQITAMKFYIGTSASAAWTGTHQVYLGEVDETTLTGITGPSAFTVVKTASFDATGTELTVEFDEPYTYGGGNLLIGTYVSVAGNWKSAYFYGVNQEENTGWYRNSGSASGSGVKFLPKTTFTYEAASTGCDMPTSIAVSNITPNGAQVTWEGDGTAWNLRYKASTDADYTMVNGLTTMSYTLGSLTENTAYSVGVQTVCSGSTSNFKSTSFTTANPCATPSNLQFANITNESATVTWTPGYQETRWTVKYKKSTDETWTEETVNGTPTLSLTGLATLTTYNVQVYNCDSYVSGNFNTASGFPYAQDFTASGIPTGWSLYTGAFNDETGTATLSSASYGWSNGTSNGVLDGNNIYANIYSTGCYKWIVTPAIPMPAGARLTFDVAYTAYSGTAQAPQQNGTDDRFIVLASTDNMATWTVLRKWDNAGSEYVLNDLTPTTLSLNFDMADYAGTNLNIAFYAESTVSNTDNNIHVDNVVFELVPSCEKPTNVAVDYQNGITATVSFNSDATAWNLDVNGTVTAITTNPYTIQGLELATTYNVKVQAVCGAGNLSEWTNPVSFTTDLCMPENQCELTFALTDAWGDGWNGAYIDVVDVATGISLAHMTNQNLNGTSGSGENELNTLTLAVCDGREIQFVWHSGSYDYECSYVVTDINGEEIFSGSDAMSEPVNYTVNCTVSTCRKPSNLAVSEIANHSAVLSWTENGEATAWNLKVNGDLIENVTNPYTLTNLIPETEYKVQVCPVCEVEKWSDEITFTTDVACPAPTDVAVSNVEPFAATVSWNGTAENYNIRYRTARGFNYGFETAEGFVVDEFPPCTTYDGDGLPTYGIDGYTMPNNTANYVGSVVSFNEYWAAHSGNVMGVFMDAIPDTEAGITANDDYFILPELTIAAGDHFTFWARSVTANYGLERMKVGVYGGNGTFTEYLAGSATEYIEVPVAWTKYDYDLTDYVGQTIQLAINCVSADAFALLFDDLFVGDPTDNTWDQTLTNVTSPYTLTGLTDETMYEVQVQAACGAEDGESEWVGATFTTPSNCAAPTNLATNDITPNAATLSWEGFHDTYNIQYRTAESRVTYYFTNFNTDADREGWTWTGSAIYGFSDPIYGFSGDDNYFLQMGWATTDEAYIISPELPAYERGAYVEFYYFGYNTANTFQLGYSTTTNDVDAFTWSDPINAPLSTYTLYNEELAAGVKYVAWKATASAQAATVFIDDFGIFGENIPAGAWQTANVVTTPYTLTNLAHDTEYEWQVQGINAGCDGGVTSWSNMATFTTPDACQVPVIDSVTNIEATTATVSWTGVQDSYNVKYGAYETMAFINFDDGVIPTSFTNDTVYAWALTDALTDEGYCIKSSNEGVASSSSTISLTATFETAGMIVFDAMFMGEGTSTIYDKCIFSIDGNQQFSYGAIGEVWNTMGYNVAAGEHTFTWTYSKDSSVNPTGDFFALDNIRLITNNITWTTIEGVTGNSYNMTGLTPNSLIAVQVQGVNDVCDGGVTEWSSEYLFITGEQTLVTQTIALTSGFNWISTYVEITLDDLKAALVEALPGTTIRIYSKSDGSTTYNGSRWRGALNTLDMSQMYMIETVADAELTFEGLPIDPAEHPITIANGTNWIAFPFSQGMSISNAFAGFASSGDRVYSKSNGNTTYNGSRWRGTLNNLVPGQGYMYESTQTEPRTFVYPTSDNKSNVSKKAGKMSFIKKQSHAEKAAVRGLSDQRKRM